MGPKGDPFVLLGVSVLLKRNRFGSQEETESRRGEAESEEGRQGQEGKVSQGTGKEWVGA